MKTKHLCILLCCFSLAGGICAEVSNDYSSLAQFAVSRSEKSRVLDRADIDLSLRFPSAAQLDSYTGRLPKSFAIPGSNQQKCPHFELSGWLSPHFE